MSDIRVRQQQELLWLILDRPPLNVLTPEMLKRLAEALRAAATHPPRLIVLTGTGEQAFCSGGDDAHLVALRQAAEEMISALDEVRRKQIPTVALVKGLASGPGCELALLCEIVIAREDATFCLPEPAARLFSTALSTAIGQEEAEHLLQQGVVLTAREAMHLGVVHQVVPRRRFVEDVEELMVMLEIVC